MGNSLAAELATVLIERAPLIFHPNSPRQLSRSWTIPEREGERVEVEKEESAESEWSKGTNEKGGWLVDGCGARDSSLCVVASHTRLQTVLTDRK